MVPDMPDVAQNKACPTCGMFVADSPLLFDAATGEYTVVQGPMPHSCPEAMSVRVAQALLEFHAASGVPMHPREYAAAKLAFPPRAA